MLLWFLACATDTAAPAAAPTWRWSDSPHMVVGRLESRPPGHELYLICSSAGVTLSVQPPLAGRVDVQLDGGRPSSVQLTPTGELAGQALVIDGAGQPMPLLHGMVGAARLQVGPVAFELPPGLGGELGRRCNGQRPAPAGS